MVAQSRSPFSSLKPLAGRALERALERALALDPDTRDALGPLQGRRLVLRLASPPLALQLTVDDRALKVGPVEEDLEPDLAVRSTLGGLLSQLPGLRPGDGAPVGKMRIEGDAELARRVQALARGFDPDWEAPFAEVFGDVLGVQIARGLAGALRQAKVTGQALARSAAEYVTEESRDVVARAELEAFHEDVDVLRDDVERLDVRIRRLRSAKGTHA
ncbi:SCP2 sterol-binding domain-containing protein [Luteimonas sp. MJ293]|uniref:ubiquinone biosynthesis accessory factor UbiJ n=1 Tax=Luteimonas sp. MJ146 TaxID=3129240 RepID=UPI0031BB0C62